MRKLLSYFLLAGLAGPCLAATANSPPKFNVAPGCKAAAEFNQAINLSVSQNYKSCMDDEEDAHRQLVQNWSSFNPQDQARCVGQTQVNGMPSYAEVLACLQVTAKSPLPSTEKKGRPDARNVNASEPTTRPDTKNETTRETTTGQDAIITGLRAEVADSARRIAALEQENSELKDAAAALKTSLAASTETNAQLQKKNSDANRALNAAEQERLSIESRLHALEDASAARTAGEHDASFYWQRVASAALGGLIALLIIDALYLLIRRKRAKPAASRAQKGQLLPFGWKTGVGTDVSDANAPARNRPIAGAPRPQQAHAV